MESPPNSTGFRGWSSKLATSELLREFGRTFTSALLAVGCLAAPALYAADCSKPREAKGTVSNSFATAVQQAAAQIEKKDYGTAISALTKMAQSDVSAYEKAVAYYNLGYAYSAKGDNKNAATAFKQALDQDAMPQKQYEQLLYNTGQLFVANGDYAQGTRLLERYLADTCSPISPDVYIFLASAYSEQKQFAKALPYVDQAIAKSPKPKESWYQLKLAIHFEQKQYKPAAETLVKLISIVPDKPDYWKQLSGILWQMNEDTESLAVLALAERQGFLQKPNEIKNLYNIYMVVGVPFKAGLFLQEALDKGRLPADERNLNDLANAWINARETDRAAGVLRKLAAQSNKGEYDFKLGAMYGDDERWGESIELLKKAIDKGGLGNKAGEAWLRLAMAYYSTKKIPEAKNALAKASGFDNTSRQASQWLEHIKTEYPDA